MAAEQSAEVSTRQLIGDALTAPLRLWVVRPDGSFDGDLPPAPALASRIHALAEAVSDREHAISEIHTLPGESEPRRVRLVARRLEDGSVAVALLELDHLQAIEAGLASYDMLSCATRAAIWEWSVAGGSRWNPRLHELLGEAPGTSTPSFEGWIACIHPEDRGRVLDEFQRVVASDAPVWETEFRILRADGSVGVVIDRCCIERAADGRPLRMLGTVTEVTELRALSAAFKTDGDHSRQSQKLESIGRLAGGIAHDFNNLLTVILTGVQFALRSLAVESPIRSDLFHVKSAAERAAKLTSQLLAFARRQVNEPTRLDLNELTAQVELLLRRIIGEHIEFETVLAPNLAPVLADRGQIEQLLINLVVNARDAMPVGGRLRVTTNNVTIDELFAAAHANLAPGEHVKLSVSDTGPGIPAEALPHIFEPFFSTKRPGAGAGLGLATSYGIVRQAGGDILLRSEPGEGTTFEILLPALAREDSPGETREPNTSASGSETVLFVEDDAAVRFMGARILSGQGYRVLQAGSGPEALELVAQHSGDIHILVTDVVMPQMSGVDLAKQLLEARPQMRVLYTSGYTEDTVAQEGVSDLRVSFLQKPYVLETLLAKVRELLDQP